MRSQRPPKKGNRSDIFQTPFEDVERILPFIPKHCKIWECAAGKGQIVQTLLKHGYDVTGTDILHGFDFLSPLCPPPPFDLILTNPPYSLKDKWLLRCYELGKPFALLLPAAAIGEQDRVNMWKRYGIEVAMPPKRIHFGTPSGKKSNAWQFHAWFCWGIDFGNNYCGRIAALD